MKKIHHLLILIFIFLLTNIIPLPGYSQSIVQDGNSISGTNTEGILLAKAKKKKKKKKKKSKSKKSKSKKSKSKKKSEGDSLGEESASTTKGSSSTKDSNSYIGIMAGYLAKGAAVSNIYADAKFALGSFFPYVDFMYTLGVNAFSLIHIGGGILYSIPIGSSFQILAGAGMQYGLWGRADHYSDNDIKKVFGPDVNVSDEDIPQSAGFIYAVPRVELVYHVASILAITGEVGGIVTIKEGVPLSDEAKKFAGTTFTIGGGIMLTF